MRKTIICTAVVLLLIGPPMPHGTAGSRLETVKKMIGRQDAILVTDSDGRVLISKNETRPLIPASTLKIFTALVALHTLGPDYRFVTEFYRDDDDNLTIKGYGDPGLVSEVLAEIALHPGTQAAARQRHHLGRLLLRSASGDPRHLFFFRTVRRPQRRLVRQLQHRVLQKRKRHLPQRRTPDAFAADGARTDQVFRT